MTDSLKKYEHKKYENDHGFEHKAKIQSLNHINKELSEYVELDNDFKFVDEIKHIMKNWK